MSAHPLPIPAYIALGSNLGDRAGNIRAAIEKLGQIEGIHVARVSSFLENPAVGGPADAPAFLNAAAQLQTSHGPRELLVDLLDIEKQLGRVRRVKWEPRIIDLDLLLYGNQIVNTAALTLPHPRMHERRFVLEPMAEIAPDVMHPTLYKTMRQLLEELE